MKIERWIDFFWYLFPSDALLDTFPTKLNWMYNTKKLEI